MCESSSPPHGGKPARRNLTAAELRELTGTRICSQVDAHTDADSSAVAAAGVDTVAIDRPRPVEARKGPPEAFMHAAVDLAPCRGEGAAYEAMNDRAYAVHMPHSLPTVSRLAEF